MLEALSTALFHFLWQGALLALIPALAMLSRSPRLRYTAACIALFAMPILFAATFATSIPHAGARSAISALHPMAAVSTAAGSPTRQIAPSMRWFVPFWIAGVALFYLRTLLSWMAVQRLRHASSAAAPAFWQHRLEQLAQRLGIRRIVALLTSDLVDVPVVAGFLRPVIFVPTALLTGMPVEQLEYLLIHELAHVRRFDYAVNLLQKAVEGLLFYHPAVWWVSHVLRTERENCCDDAVVAMTETRGGAREYASVLASLERNRNTPALAASGGNLVNRIGRLLNRPNRFAPAPALSLVVVLVCAALAVAVYAQTPTAPPMTPFEKWAAEDVAYIITDAERNAFKRLTTDEEHEKFVEQFWDRRDPTPGTPANEFKDEHYRRIAYANTRFQSAIPGWKSDRGRIYITYGPPDEIDSHTAERWELWRYRYIDGIGNDVIIRFEDRDNDGSYPMVGSPNGPGGRGR